MIVFLQSCLYALLGFVRRLRVWVSDGDPLGERPRVGPSMQRAKARLGPAGNPPHESLDARCGLPHD